MDKPGLRDALPQPRQSDTRNDPFWSSLDSSLSAAAAATPQPAEPVAKRDLDVGLGDVARGVGAGALDLVGGIGELARQASNFGKENAGKQGGDYLEQARANMANKLSPLLDVVAGAGDLAASGAESLNDGMSADAKEALGRRLVDETPEGRLTLGDGAGDIDVWAMKMAQGVGSLLPTLAAGGVTGVAAKASIGRAVTASMVKRGATQEVAEAVAAKAVSKIATGAAVTTGTTGSVGSAGVNTRDTVLGMSFDELAGSDTFRQSFTRIDQDQQTAHLSDEEKLGLAREETANLASRATMSDAKVWGAAAMGSMMGDAMLFKMLAGKAATGGVLKGAAKGAAGEGISETLEEGVQQYAVNESLNEVAAADIDPMKGVMSSAIEGGLIGMGTGGAVGAVGRARGGKHASQEDGVGTDPVAEPSAPVTEGAAGPAVDPNFASVPLEDGEQAPSASQAEGELNPLGPSASQFDELRDVPAYLRRDDTAARFKGMAADSEVQRALAGEFGQSVQELVASQMQAGDQGKSLYERAQAGELGLDPFAGNKSAQQVAMENQRPALPLKDVIFAGDANAARGMTKEGHFDDKQAGTGPQFRGAERTRWQSGQEGDVLPPEASSTKPAGELPGAVIEGEASEVGNELPHRNVVYGNDLRAEQQRAADLARRERELNNQPLKIGQSETLFAGGTPGADPRNSAYTPPKLSRDQVDTSMGEQSTRDPRSPVAQSIEQAGIATDSVFGPLQTLRITRKGKPFATEKEAAMASRKGQEMPVPLNGGGFGVAAIGEVQQAQAQQGAVKQPSSNSAQQDRQDGKTEIAQNGMVIVHGSGNPGMSEQDIQIVRASGQKQGKKGRVYGGFYGTSEQDAHQAQAYADMMGGTPTLYDVKIKPGTKVLHKQGDITRLSESYINELVSQGYGVVTGTDPRGQTEHVVIDKSAVASMAPRGAQATPSQVDDINVADMRQPSDQPAKNVSADTVPAPSATAGEASQLVPAIDTGYREVIPGNQPQVEVSNEPVTPIPAISSERSGDQPGAGEPAAAGAGPAVAGLTDRAGSGDRADLAAPAPVPDGQQQNDPTLTAPATDAGAAVSGRIGEEELRDRDLLKEHGGHWKYRSAVGAGWFTANTKEAAIERAEEAYRKAVSKGEPVPTRDERFAQADAELFSEMDRRYGKMSTPELEAEYQRLGGEVGDLQKSGSGEFNGNGGRRTGAAVSNEGARQVGEERLRLGVYMKMRRDRDTAGSGAKSQQIEPANDWRGAKSATDYHAAKRRLFSGEMEFSEFQAMSRSALDNAPSLRAELEKKTKQDLLDQMSRFNAARYKNDKKAVVVEAAYNQLIGDLRWAANGDGNTISETYAIGGARQSIEERVAKALDGLTPERYQLFRDKQLSDVAEMQRRREELKRSLTDPQTLDDFKAFIERRGIDKLTQEQRVRYEDMVAARNLDRREQERSAKGNETAPSATSSDIIKTKHTKTGDDLFVVQMGDRVERDAYNRINAHAKTLGGWYSSFRGKGAVPGFQFKSEEKATEFRAWLGGEVGGASPEVAPDQSTDSEAQPAGKSKQVEALRNRAASARAKAEAVFNAARKENTARRASMAANARTNAERDLRFAGLLEAIATGIENGEITYLRNLANGAQLEELQSALNRGLWSLPATKIDALVSDGVINRDDSSRYSWSDKATPEQMVEGVSMPGMDYHTDRLREVAIKMQGSSGFKQAGAKVMSLVKAAANRDNKTTTLSDPELIAKLKAYVTGSDDYSTSTIKDQIAGYGRLERMGITNHTELRAALRELVRLQRGLNETAPQRDPVTEKTNALKRRLLNNRNAFIDFFPTPEEYAADLVDRLGIEPGMVVLEPSAGHGMLAEAARDAGATVEAVEVASDLRDILQEKGFSLVGNDFMETTPSQRYDAVVMNPPFSNDMDIDHVRHAFGHLKPGGRLAAIVSSMAGQRSNKKNKAFREWLDDLGASEEMMPEGAFKDSLNPTSVRTKIITIEKPVDAVKGPELKAGTRATLHTPKGKPVEVQYRLMESGDLVASHEFDGTVNRHYPQELQPRDRSKSTYQVQVRQIANNPEGRRLGASPETDRGAPIVRDGIVESGNGRTIGLQQAYRQGSADAYREWLMEHAEDFGISPDEVAAMSQPVLVRERLTEMSEAERRDFVVDSNTDAKMANSASEDANVDAGKLDDKLMGMLNIPEGGDLLAMSNEPFLNAFARAIGENTLNQYKDDRGRWNDAYRRRVSAAIFAYGYDNASLLKAATGDSDQVGKNLIGALMNNAGKMAELRSAMPEHAADLSNILAEGVTVMSDARRNHQAISEIVNQGDMVSGGISRAGGAMAEMLADASRSAKRMTETIGAILDMLNHAAKHAGQPDLLTGKPSDPISAEEAINAQEREYRTRKEREQSALRPSQDFFGVSGPRNDHGKNTGVSGSAGEGQAKGAGKLTSAVVEVSGVKIRIPTIDEEQQRLYNQATHRGHGVNFASGISTGVGRILNDLNDAGLLVTAEQRAAAEDEVQAWANEEAINASKLMRDGIKNPSWAITGRSGRKAQSSAAQDAENRRQAAHHKDQSDRITALRGELKKLRPKEVIGKESFNYAWGKAKGMIADYASAQSNGQPNLLASLRKSMNAELARYLQSMGKIDAPNFIKTLKEQDQRLKAAGHDGLVAIVGARSNPGKIISNAIDGRIRFSKQAMSQGMRPAKHLTRKEAELVTKEWFKQYRGASGIDVQIHATQAELEKALGLAAQDGLIRRAAFDDDSGTLHVAADTIANPKRMREILRHEVLAHYGLANVLGDGEYTKLMSRLIQSQKDPSMKPVWDWVNTHYADEDIGTKAEEVVAHLAELEQGAWGRGWDRVVAWVTRALRAVGFVPDGITAAETRSLIEGLGKQLRRTGQEDGGSGGKKFSQEEKLGEDTFKPYPGEAEEYRRQLSKVMTSPKSGELVIEMGRTPLVLQAVGAPDLPLRITRDIVRKATNGVKHDVPMPVIEQLPELLHDPIAVFDSKTEQGAKTILIDARDVSGRPIITAVHLNAKAGRIDINRIASIYGKDNSHRVLMGWVEEGLLRYAKEKQNPLGTTQGLQLPKRGSPERVYDSNILSRGDLAKDADKIRDRVAAAGHAAPSRSEQESARDDGPFPPDGLKFSQTNSAADEALQKLNLGPKPDIIDKTKASLNKLRQVDRGVVSSWIDRVIKKANTEVLDALAPIKYAEEAAGITDAADSGYVAARMATGAASTMQATMLYGLPEWNDGVIQRKAGTGEKDALLGIFADLGADLHNWLGWMAGHRAELLMAQGRENLLDANDIAALKGQGKGKEAKFLDAKARWNRLNAATLDLAQEAGLFTKEARAEFESEWYIPFFRESDDGDVIAPFKTKGIANQNSGIKKLKGGEANTNDLLENIFTSTSKLIDASMKNMAAQKTVWNLADTGIIEVIPKPNKMDYQALANGKDRIMVKLEGEDYMIRVEDPDLYRAMTFFDRKPFSAMVNVAAKAKRLLTAGVTASPEFMLRNFLRDSLSSWAISKDGFRPVIDSIKGVKKTLAMDGSTIDVMFSGASFLGGYVNGNDPEAMADTVRKSLRRKGMTPEQIARYEKSIIRNAAQAKGVVANVWEKYNRYGEAFENANREAVYAAAIKAGKSHAQAAFESKDLMDFSMLGASRTMQVMTQLLPFFNARVQGLGKLSRELRDNPREIAKRAGMITAASLALLALNWDDERYEKLPDWDKDANWHFWIGDEEFRIPKPFEIGVLFGTIPERMVRAMGGKDTGAQLGKAIARAVGETFALNPTPQIVKPLVESYFNYDAFRGIPIENAQDLAVQAEARYNEQTSLMMRELGETLGMSPKKLEHLLIGYTGTIGSYVMATADGLIRASRPGESASWRADEIPLVKAVYRGTGPAKSTQHMEEFYRMLNEVNQLKRTVDQYRSEGLTDKANELLEEQGGILKSRRSLSRTQQQVRVVRNKIELIQRDRTLTAEEKRRRIDEMLARRNDLVYQAVNKNKSNWE
ncbi:LPD38 domain-containing protein [Aeromonas sp. QDB25]|uniref:LPD38 domain-containing protein n=1 Tax=Aeromonas sp. QDB25 TaxID=2989832 RepID=UPI003FA424E5